MAKINSLKENEIISRTIGVELIFGSWNGKLKGLPSYFDDNVFKYAIKRRLNVIEKDCRNDFRAYTFLLGTGRVLPFKAYDTWKDLYLKYEVLFKEEIRKIFANYEDLVIEAKRASLETSKECYKSITGKEETPPLTFQEKISYEMLSKMPSKKDLMEFFRYGIKFSLPYDFLKSIDVKNLMHEEWVNKFRDAMKLSDEAEMNKEEALAKRIASQYSQKCSDWLFPYIDSLKLKCLNYKAFLKINRHLEDLELLNFWDDGIIKNHISSCKDYINRETRHELSNRLCKFLAYVNGDFAKEID